MAGMSKESGTRSSLLWEVERLLNECGQLPQILLMENVPEVIGKKNIKDFQIWQNFLESKGYKNYVEILNAKDYGIPQNRRRCFMVSILGNYNYSFPNKKKLKLRLKDMLEDEVDEKYYLSDEQILKILYWNCYQKPFEKVLGKQSISPTITARGAGENHSGMILYSSNLNNTTNLQNEFLKIKEETKKGYAEAYEGDGVYINRPHQKRGVVQHGMIQTIKCSPDVGVVVRDKSLFTETQTKMFTKDGNVKRYIDSDIVDEFKEGQVADISFSNGYGHGTIVHNECPTITATNASSFITKVKDKRGNILPCYKDGKQLTDTIHNSQRLFDGLRVRKLTPKECFRLMGFEDDDYEAASKVNSDSQLYKQAGNSIVTTCLMAIFGELLGIDYIEKINQLLNEIKNDI